MLWLHLVLLAIRACHKIHVLLHPIQDILSHSSTYLMYCVYFLCFRDFYKDFCTLIWFFYNFTLPIYYNLPIFKWFYCYFLFYNVLFTMSKWPNFKQIIYGIHKLLFIYYYFIVSNIIGNIFLFSRLALIMTLFLSYLHFRLEDGCCYSSFQK